MEKLVYTYALVKSLYDQGKDYIDSFWPFALKVFPVNGNFVALNHIQEELEEEFGLRVPLHTLKTILNRALRKGYVQRKGTGYYKIEEKGLQYLDILEDDKEVERRLNALFDDIRQFLDEHDISINMAQIQDALLALLRKNTDPLIEFFNPASASGELAISKVKVTETEALLIDYIKVAEQQKPEHYKTLQNMVFGSVISTILNSPDPSVVAEIGSRRFKRCQVFLDTNFIFSTLGLHTPEFNEPAKELFNLLKKHKFELRVFSFTVDEICNVIHGYIREAYRYPTTVHVDTIYSSLKRRGWTNSDAREFIMSIEDKLCNLGIQIEWVKDVDLQNYNPLDDGLRSLMQKYKPQQSIFNQNHDLAAVEKIKELRGQPVRRIEDSKVLFVTSDKRLSRFNFMGMGHQKDGTVCEVILDSLLTNILWLKDPSAKIPLKSIIGAYSRELFVKRRIWDRFYENLRKLKREGKVSDEAISTLFYHNYIEDVLRELDETEIDEITPEFILEEIEKASKLSEKELKEKEKEFLQRLEGEVSKKEQEKEREWLEKLRRIKKGLRKAAENSARRYVWIARILIIILFAIPLIICVATKNWKAFGNVARIISAIATIIALAIGSVDRIWKGLERKIADKIYNGKIKEARLHEVS